jgi:hypothetical protein
MTCRKDLEEPCEKRTSRDMPIVALDFEFAGLKVCIIVEASRKERGVNIIRDNDER